jgi:hypothetical protein
MKLRSCIATEENCHSRADGNRLSPGNRGIQQQDVAFIERCSGQFARQYWSFIYKDQQTRLNVAASGENSRREFGTQQPCQNLNGSRHRTSTFEFQRELRPVGRISQLSFKLKCDLHWRCFWRQRLSADLMRECSNTFHAISGESIRAQTLTRFKLRCENSNQVAVIRRVPVEPTVGCDRGDRVGSRTTRWIKNHTNVVNEKAAQRHGTLIITNPR